MKNMIRKITSAFCASVMLFTVSAPSVMAEENDKLPSGKTISEFEDEMIKLPKKTEDISIDYSESGAVGVFRGDEILYTNYFGATDWDKGIKVDNNNNGSYESHRRLAGIDISAFYQG